MSKNDKSLAVQQLEALSSIPGALKIITNEVQPDLREDRKDRRSAAKADVDLHRPDSFVCHDVVRIEGPDHRGLYTAFSAEGDWCRGEEKALLARLQEWNAVQTQENASERS